MDIVQSVFLTACVFFILVTIHEWGHFIFAKRAGILVREFAIGFGPKLFTRTHGETTYTLRLFPIGGFVRMAGEDVEICEIKPGHTIAVHLSTDNKVTTIYVDQLDKQQHVIRGEVKRIDYNYKLTVTLAVDGQDVEYFIHPQARMIVKGNSIQIAPHNRKFSSKTVWQRALTIFAGPGMNFILAGFLFAVYIVQAGVPVHIQVKKVESGMPADKVDLQPGDIIEKVNNIYVGSNFQQILTSIYEANNMPMSWEVRRGEQHFMRTITPRAGKIGVNFVSQNRPASFADVCSYTANYMSTTTKQIIYTFRDLILGQLELNKLGGPIQTFEVTGQIAMQGVQQLTRWAAILSLYLGIFNLLPIPGLDGSRLVFLFIEALRRKPIDANKENIVHFVGIALLLLLMLLLTYNDVLRISKIVTNIIGYK